MERKIDLVLRLATPVLSPAQFPLISDVRRRLDSLPTSSGFRALGSGNILLPLGGGKFVQLRSVLI